MDPVKLWCLFARASEVTNFLPPWKGVPPEVRATILDDMYKDAFTKISVKDQQKRAIMISLECAKVAHSLLFSSIS